MDENQKETAENFYERLKTELDKSNTWPAEYLFKFIVPSVNNNANFVQEQFDNIGAVIKTTQSKTGKFTSISVDVLMQNADEIIIKYKEVSVIKGIVSL
jgi:putative lipoic acid-binding regulatory protein